MNLQNNLFYLKTTQNQVKNYMSSKQKCRKIGKFVVVEGNINQIYQIEIYQANKLSNVDKDLLAFLFNAINSQIAVCSFSIISRASFKKHTTVFRNFEDQETKKLSEILELENNDILFKFQYFTSEQQDFNNLREKYTQIIDLFLKYYKKILQINQEEQPIDFQEEVLQLIKQIKLIL